MKQPIVGYHCDADDDWVARLDCGHFQHVRHSPPWVYRDWAITSSGRMKMLGFNLECVKCDEGAPRDFQSMRNADSSERERPNSTPRKDI